ncbi:phytoene/squalene synthase family protein [Gordonia sp. PP30]|uniref:phytoene/squalene synthase family protein n=1 Tax=Gordonia sp. PP30 TaxID=2935861 RepID=UPI001FFF462C|nr:phytoene/squalene synthase family protein [Gordonia sp. PP30]UQE73600.1 phytoene/squalene synthase family protein [Gordonia sp. PP30]
MTERGYRIGRAMTARAGRTYYLAAGLLPADRRRGVYALYGFARMADDIVDRSPQAPAAQVAALDALAAGLTAALDGESLPDPSLTADQWALLHSLAATVERFGIDPATFGAFLRSMRMDVPGTAEFRSRYRSFAELHDYTYGSAAVIGLQMLPILGVSPGGSGGVSYDDVAGGAALLGEAFQLTNFLRDVAEDLDRDRIYLPADHLAAFGVDEEVLRTDVHRGRPGRALRAALRHLIAINRDQYRRTAPAIAALPGRTRPAIAAAARSYADILTEIERSDYDVLSRRAVVPKRRRVVHAARALLPAG